MSFATFITSLALAIPAMAVDLSLEERVKRVAFTLNIAAEEYQEGVHQGKIVNPEEYEEASAFLARARDQFGRAADSVKLDDFDRDPIEEEFASLTKGIAAKKDKAAVTAQLRRLVASLEKAFDVSTVSKPARWPSIKRGEKHYKDRCAMCHGERGDANGPASEGLSPKAAAFNDKAFIAQIPPFTHFQVVSVGVGGTAMVSWADHFDEATRWDLVAYLRGFTLERERVARGKALRERLGGLPSEFEDPGTPALLSDQQLEAKLAQAFPKLGKEEHRDLTAYLRGREPDTLDEPVAAAPKSPDVGATVKKIEASLARGLELFDGKAYAEASDVMLEAYLHYEKIESRMAIEAASLNQSLEATFPRLRGMMASDIRRADAETAIQAIRNDLARLPRGGAESSTPWSLFLQALLIIFREGFEAILIIGAIAAYLKRAGHAPKLRTFYAGAWAGVAASFATAFVVDRLLKMTRIGQEALEGIIMLVAAGFLFYVSYWLINIAEARRWNQFLRGRVNNALGTNSLLALAMVAFLAVYREGFETILFYKALWALAPAGNAGPIIAGFAAGIAALAAAFLIFSRLGLRLPIRTSFIATSALLYGMAFLFIGQGILELQEAGWINARQTPWRFSLPLLGIYPTWQSTGAQLLLLLAGLTGVIWTQKRPEPQDAEAVRSSREKEAALNGGSQ